MHSECQFLTTQAAQPGLDTVALIQQNRAEVLLNTLYYTPLMFFYSAYRNTDKGRQAQKMLSASELTFSYIFTSLFILKTEMMLTVTVRIGT